MKNKMSKKKKENDFYPFHLPNRKKRSNILLAISNFVRYPISSILKFTFQVLNKNQRSRVTLIFFPLHAFHTTLNIFFVQNAYSRCTTRLYPNTPGIMHTI